MSVTRATDLWEGAGDIPSFLRRTDGPGAIPFHLLAKIFPLMEGEAFADLVEDISAHGLHEPIVLYEGKILDGRNRYLASKAAEVAPRFETYTGSDPLGFVISKNLHRRHLTESQRAMVAANLATMRQGARTDLSPIGEMSQSQAAELLNVGKRSVERAKIVLSEGAAPNLSKRCKPASCRCPAPKKESGRPHHRRCNVPLLRARARSL